MPTRVADLLSDLVAIDSVNPSLVPGGAGEGVPGAPPEPGHEPGHGPTADEATGITGEGPDDEDGA